ncbi:MAG: hypothetical protein SVX43_10950 [Cyanobacteriota bacterium]|nr:hypothetical protein [Cyanobacteriota bacterium]
MQQTDNTEFNEMMGELIKAYPSLDPNAIAEEAAKPDELRWQETHRENYKKWVKRRVILEIDKLRILRGNIPPELLEKGGELMVTLKREQESAQTDDAIALREATGRERQPSP